MTTDEQFKARRALAHSFPVYSIVLVIGLTEAAMAWRSLEFEQQQKIKHRKTHPYRRWLINHPVLSWKDYWTTTVRRVPVLTALTLLPLCT